MSGSDRGEHSKARLIGAAIVLILGVALYWGMFWNAGYQSGQNERKANIEAEHYASQTAEQIDRKCGAKTGQPASECIAEIVKAERESQRSESDLAAQWKAADWVMWAGILAGAQLMATAVGLYFVKRTLDATLEAVEDTGRATAAMREANRIARDAQRPWVTITLEIEQVTSTRERLNVEGNLVYKNIGNTVARQFNPRTSVFFSNDDFTNRILSIFEEWNSRVPVTSSVLLPGEELRQQCDIIGDKRRIPWIEDSQGKRTFCIAVAGAFYMSDDQTDHYWTYRPFIVIRAEKGLKFIDLTDDMPALLKKDRVMADLTGGSSTR